MDAYEGKPGAVKSNGPQVLWSIRLVRQKRAGPPPLPATRVPTRSAIREQDMQESELWRTERRGLDEIVFLDSVADDDWAPVDEELIEDDEADGDRRAESLAPVSLETDADVERGEEGFGMPVGRWPAALAFSASVAAVVLCGAFAISALHQPRGAASSTLGLIGQNDASNVLEGAGFRGPPVVLPEVVIVVASR